jgi:hypothetical protein
MKFPLVYEATSSRRDFVRLLARATDDPALKETPDGFAGQGWHVRLTAIAPLEIGSVRLERHRVEISFQGLSGDEQEVFMRRFTQHYQRGGG